MLNQYINNDTTGDKKKKQKTDIFQKLINDIFNLSEEEMWTQRNLDCHQPKKKSRYTEKVKVDRQIERLYSMKEEVCPHDIDTIYKKTLEDQLTENFIAKKQWVRRWKPTIESSINRAKQNDTTSNKLIWDCFNHGKRPFHRVDRS